MAIKTYGGGMPGLGWLGTAYAALNNPLVQKALKYGYDSLT